MRDPDRPASQKNVASEGFELLFNLDDYATTGKVPSVLAGVWHWSARLGAVRSRAVVGFGGARTYALIENIRTYLATDLADLFDAGQLRAVIDRTFPLDDIAGAHRRVDTHRKRGVVVVDLSQLHG